MLVYHKEPLGYTTIGGQRVYGKYFSYGRFGPTDIPRSLYRKNKDLLEEVVYTSALLEERFGKKFPDIRFKISEFWRVDFNKLVEIARLMGIEYIPSKKPTDLERRALRKSVISHITD